MAVVGVITAGAMALAGIPPAYYDGGYYGGCYLKKYVTYYGGVVFKKVCY